MKSPNMKTPQELMREHYPEFLKDLELFKNVFGNIKREHIKCGVGEFGKPLTGTAVIPCLSSGKPLTRIQLSKKYGEKKCPN